MKSEIKKLKSLLDSNNLSSLVLFGRQIFGKSKIKPEHCYSVFLFAAEAKNYPLDKFKQKRKLSKGQNWKAEYTKELKKRIETAHNHLS